MTAKTYKTITCKKSGGVVRSAFNRPEHRNGITGSMTLELARLRRCRKLSARFWRNGNRSPRVSKSLSL